MKPDRIVIHLSPSAPPATLRELLALEGRPGVLRVEQLAKLPATPAGQARDPGELTVRDRGDGRTVVALRDEGRLLAQLKPQERELFLFLRDALRIFHSVAALRAAAQFPAALLESSDNAVRAVYSSLRKQLCETDYPLAAHRSRFGFVAYARPEDLARAGRR